MSGKAVGCSTCFHGVFQSGQACGAKAKYNRCPWAQPCIPASLVLGCCCWCVHVAHVMAGRGTVPPVRRTWHQGQPMTCGGAPAHSRTGPQWWQ